MHAPAGAVQALCESLAACGGSWSVSGVMTAASIGAAKAGGYARYLESKTVVPERGDYYLTPDGEMAQAPGRWLASPETLARLGIEGRAVEGRDFIALMEGRHPLPGPDRSHRLRGNEHNERGSDLNRGSRWDVLAWGMDWVRLKAGGLGNGAPEGLWGFWVGLLGRRLLRRTDNDQ